MFWPSVASVIMLVCWQLFIIQIISLIKTNYWSSHARVYCFLGCNPYLDWWVEISGVFLSVTSPLMSIMSSVAMSLVGIHVVWHILWAQQRTASYKHTSLPCPFSQLDFQTVMMELHTIRNIYCGLSSLQAYRQGVLLQKKYLFWLLGLLPGQEKIKQMSGSWMSNRIILKSDLSC